MERLKYWFGGRHSTINQHYSELANDSDEKSNKNKDLSTNEIRLNEQHKPSLKTETTQTNEEVKGVDGTADQWSLIRQYFPLEEGDCLSCKLVAVGTLMSFSFVALYIHALSRGKYQGTKRIVLTAVDFGIIGGAQYLAFCRFFDYGVFAKKEKGTEDKLAVKESN